MILKVKSKRTKGPSDFLHMQTHLYLHFKFFVYVALGLFTVTKMFIQHLNYIWTTALALDVS